MRRQGKAADFWSDRGLSQASDDNRIVQKDDPPTQDYFGRTCAGSRNHVAEIMDWIVVLPSVGDDGLHFARHKICGQTIQYGVKKLEVSRHYGAIKIAVAGYAEYASAGGARFGHKAAAGFDPVCRISVPGPVGQDVDHRLLTSNPLEQPEFMPWMSQHDCGGAGVAHSGTLVGWTKQRGCGLGLGQAR
ncbi:hypothetical protein D3C80_1279380 [compost metagenome]